MRAIPGIRDWLVGGEKNGVRIRVKTGGFEAYLNVSDTHFGKMTIGEFSEVHYFTRS
jgi:hypothetical protein